MDTLAFRDSLRLLRTGALLFVAGKADRGLLGSWFAVGCGGATLLVALSPWAVALAMLLVLAGLTMSISNTAANALVQSVATASLRGQTVSLCMSRCAAVCGSVVS